MPSLNDFGPALVASMETVTDLVTIIGADGTIEYMNPYGLQLLGYPSSEDVVGLSLVELIHPDDLDRVLVSMARVFDADANIPGRPAVLRARRADGTFVRVEANGGVSSGLDTPLSRVVITARPTTDADLHERLMNLLTTGAPSEKSFELVPDFGAWRQPALLHAVFVLDDDGLPLAFGSPALLELGGLDDPSSPWASADWPDGEILVAVDELGPVARDRARSRGITWLRARAVGDTLHRGHAVVVMGHHEGSPLAAERSTLEFAWMALDKMSALLEMALAWRFQATELRRAAATDPLTGLANRAGFWTSYNHTTASGAGHPVGVLCIDLDHFKPVNDTYGHAVGDALLIEVADRLRNLVRPGDLVARPGGDEFTVVVHDLGEEQVDAVADRIVHELCAPFTIGGRRIEIGASVGVAVAHVVGFDPDELLAAADKALYEAKDTGRNQWVRARA